MRTNFHRRHKTPRIKWILAILLISCVCVIFWIIMASMTLNEQFENKLDDITKPYSYPEPIIKVIKQQQTKNTQLHYESEPILSRISWQNTLNTMEIRDTSNYERIIAIGDLHGDFQQTIKILTLTKLINSDQNWIANHTILIQTGDIIDRGSNSIDIYKLFLKLNKQCIKYNSLVLNQIGNHEHLNFINDFTYVNAQEINAYGGFNAWKKLMSFQSNIGKFLRNLPIARIIGNTLFVHAGIIPIIAMEFEQNITLLNERFHDTVMDISINADVNPLSFYQLLTPFEQHLMGINSPIWTRYFEPAYYDYNMLSVVFQYWNEGNFTAGTVAAPIVTQMDKIKLYMCDKLKEVLEIYEVKRMVIGHNVQTKGAVKTYCENQLYAIDVGMSEFYGGNLAALEIDPKTENVHIITDPDNPPHDLKPFGGFDMKALLLQLRNQNFNAQMEAI